MTPPATTRRSELTDLRVVVSERAPKDVALISPVGGERVLVLRWPQTQDNATDRILERFPNEHVDDVRRFVSKHLPDTVSFDRLLGHSANLPLPEWIAPPSNGAPVKVKVGKTAKLVSSAAIALLCTATLAGYAIVRDMTDSLLDKPEFQGLARAAGLECTVLDKNSADCRNPRMGTSWKVTATERDDPSEPNHYRFVSGDKLAVIQIFSSEQERVEYPVNAAYARLWPYRTGRDRVSISSTDEPVVLALAGAADATVLRGAARGLAPAGTTPMLPTPSASATPTEPEWRERATHTPLLPSDNEQPWPTGGRTGMLVGDPETAQKPAWRPQSEPLASTGTPEPQSTPEGDQGQNSDGQGQNGPAPSSTTPTQAPTKTDAKSGVSVQLPVVTVSIGLGI